MIPRHVAIFLEHLRGGGAEHNMLRLAGALASAGHRVQVVASDASGAVDAWLPDHVEIVDLAQRHYPLTFIALGRWMRTSRPDVVISAISAANVIAVAARQISGTSTPVIITERNTPSVQRQHAQGLRRRVVTPWLMRHYYPRADAIVGVSRGVAADTITFARLPGAARKRTLTIPNPVVDSNLVDRARLPIDDRWHAMVAGRRVVLSVGRLEPHKAHDVLIDAFATVARDHDDVVLVILGEGPQRDAIAAHAAERGVADRVIMAGFQPNPYAWMSYAQVLVLTSRYEGLPTVLVEALACGAQVVATNAPSGADEILDGGRWGWLVPVDNVEAIADGIDHALAEGRRAAPPAEALARYRPEVVLAQWQQLIDDVVSAGGVDLREHG